MDEKESKALEPKRENSVARSSDFAARTLEDRLSRSAPGGAAQENRLPERTASKIQQTIEAALNRLVADPQRLEFVIIEVDANTNQFVQFALNGSLRGEVVGEENLGPAELARYDQAAILRLGFTDFDLNHGQDWYPPLDVPAIARIAAVAMREGLGVPDDSPLRVSTAVD